MANQAVYGIVANKATAETLVQALVDAGVTPHDISFLSSQGGDFKEIGTSTTGMETSRNWRTEERITDYPTDTTTGQMRSTTQHSTDYPTDTTTGQMRGTTPHSKGSNARQKSEMGQHSEMSQQGGMGTEKHSKAPEGTTTGAVTGGIIGGTLGLLAGIGALAIPGIGPFIAAGPLMATLAGIGAGSTVGGITGALIGAGIPEYEAKRYENRLKEGGILLSVRAINDDTAKRIKDLLQKNGAENVSVSSEATTSKNHNKNK